MKLPKELRKLDVWDSQLREAIVRDCANRRVKVQILPGDMPDEMWEVLHTDRDAAAEALRIVVRQALDEYEQAILARYDLEPK